MITNCFQINEALQLMPVITERVVHELQRPEARIWIDLQAFEPGELEEWMDKLDVRGLSRRLCEEAGDRSGFYPLKQEIVMVIPTLADTETPEEVKYFTLLCREHLLLTLHPKSLMNPQQIIEEIKDSEYWLPERSIAGLVSAIMIDRSLNGLRQTTNLRDSIGILEERMDREPETVKAEQILDLRSKLLTLGAVICDQLPTLESLSLTDKPFFKIKEAQEFMNCALANLKAASGSLDWLNQRIGALRSGFEMHAQDQTNRRLNILTILSAIFNPATLMAGIWGMNFERMPELKYPFGYPVALGFMVLIGLLMYLFFRRGGWFD
jgi:magnesium transporter